MQRAPCQVCTCHLESAGIQDMHFGQNLHFCSNFGLLTPKHVPSHSGRGPRFQGNQPVIIWTPQSGQNPSIGPSAEGIRQERWAAKCKLAFRPLWLETRALREGSFQEFTTTDKIKLAWRTQGQKQEPQWLLVKNRGQMTPILIETNPITIGKPLLLLPSWVPPPLLPTSGLRPHPSVPACPQWMSRFRCVGLES